jgi:SAM-dependent methyltransferase
VIAPIDVPTRATAEFIAAHVPTGGSILEVGCGEGHLALELRSRGFDVIGVDADETNVLRARDRGVCVMRASWPEIDVAPVDAVAFTRSLHHIHPLDGAVRKAREVLRPAGTLLVDDFAFDQADRTTMRWFLDVVRSGAVRALLTASRHEFVTMLLAAADPMEAWHMRHDHELHSMEAMTRSISEFLAIREARAVPYLYRYLVPVFPETPDAAALVDEVHREEQRLGELGEIVLIGRRVVGSHRESGE